MSKIVALVGISGAGKSVRAKAIQEEMKAEGADVLIIGRDKIREMLYGYTEATVKAYYEHPDFGIREYKVNEVQDVIIKQALAEGKSVIVDNTHLRKKYLTALSKYGVDVEFELVETALVECIKRDVNRTRTVGEVVIRKQFEQLNQLKKLMNLDEGLKFKGYAHIKQDKTLPDAFIFDIDGTLALMHNRSPYDMKKVREDKLNFPVFKAYEAAKKAGYKIIICTGREDGKGRDGTLAWLDDFNIKYDEFHMRPAENFESDWKIKQVMWEDLVKRYHIVAMYDDRNQVVEHARKLGFTVFQVAEGNF